MMYEGEYPSHNRYNRIFSTTKKRARNTQFDHVPEEDSDYIQSPIDLRSEIVPQSEFAHANQRRRFN